MLSMAALTGSTTFTAGAATGAATRTAVIRTPDAAVVCGYVASKGGVDLSCAVRGGLRPRPSSAGIDKSCTRSPTTVQLSMHGPGGVACYNLPLSLLPIARIVPYGTTWRDWPFVCRSAIAGLTCTNLDHQGFFLSRTHYHLVG